MKQSKFIKINRFIMVFMLLLTLFGTSVACNKKSIEYTVTFESNGGSAVTAIVCNDGQSITLPSAPTKDGFTFSGCF